MAIDNSNPNTIEEQAGIENLETQIQPLTEANQYELPNHLDEFLTVDFWNHLNLEQKQYLNSYQNLPEPLRGVVPDSVWSSYDFNKKAEIMMQHGLLPEFSLSYDSDPIATNSESLEPVSTDSEVSTDELTEKVEAGNKRIEEIEREFEAKSNNLEKGSGALTMEEQKRVDTEIGKTVNTVVPIQFSNGYQVSSQLINNAQNLADDSDADDSNVWLSKLIQKMKDMQVN